MPPRSSIEHLPAELKAWLDQELIARRFGDHVALAEALAGKGYKISKSAVGRYSLALQAEREAYRKTFEMVRAITDEMGEDGRSMAAATLALAHEAVLRLQIELRKETPDPVAVAKMCRSVSSLVRTTVVRERWDTELEERLRREMADEVQEAAVEAGISGELAEELRRKLLGVRA